MKNIFKRNQIIITVVALMLVAAGYLSYTTDTNKSVQTTTTDVQEELEYAGIGDAKLVSSNSLESSNEETVNNNETMPSAVVDNVMSNELKNNIPDSSNTTSENSKVSEDVKEYFSSSRLARENMYSQMLDSYKKILESTSINETQKSIAQTEIKNINEIKNKIMICENLIKTKDIEDLIIFVNDSSISVVVRIDTLKEEQIAQIQNIITREMNVEITNIHISNK